MQLWTPEHIRSLLPAVAGMIVLAVGLRIWLRKREWKIRMIPLQIVAVLLVCMEIGKQVLSLKNGYDLYHLPFHFCSMFIFMVPIMAFYRGKHQAKIGGITAALCMSAALLMLIYPDLIYSAGNVQNFFKGYFDFHTVAFHNLVLFAAILIIALELHTPAPKGEAKATALYMLVFCVISASMANLLQTNFNNFYSCNIPPLESVRQSLQSVLGYGLTQVLYVLIVTPLNIGFVQMSYWFYRLCRGILARFTHKN